MTDPATAAPARDDSPLLETRNLSKHYALAGGLSQRLRGKEKEVLRAVDGVSISIKRGETLGLVGESGCGKSTFGRLLLHLEQPTAGEMLYEGELVDGAKASGLRRKIQIIFQDPFSSLNPRKTVGDALQEVLSVHNLCPKDARKARVAELLDRVGLSPEMASRRPRQFSGGQRQRIGIARALAMGPEFIVADEPVSALDVSVQAQVLNLLTELQEELNLTYLLISHNLGVVRHLTRRIVVMYLGRLVEESPTAELFQEPLHPYTQALIRAVPDIDPDRTVETVAVEGDLPNPIHPPSGCHFHPRCPFAMDICRIEYPQARQVAPGRVVACHLYDAQVAAAGGEVAASSGT
jgi:oligopeptide/dipeptide ABC transporter ATP-binding protein